jgi:hypothetical protein
MRSCIILKIDGLSNSKFCNLTSFIDSNLNIIMAPEGHTFSVVFEGNIIDVGSYHLVKIINAKQNVHPIGLETNIVLEVVTTLAVGKSEDDFLVPRWMIDNLWDALGLFIKI